MDEFTDAQLEQKIARVKASPEYAAYRAKLDEIAPAYSDAEKNLQSHLAALVQEQRNRAASGTATAILQSVAKVPEKRKLQRPVSWTAGGFVHAKQGGSKSEDLSFKRQFEQVDKADDVFFDVKQQLEGLEAPESITEEQLAKVKKAKAAIEEGMLWAEDQAQLIDIAFKFGWPTAQEYQGELVVATEEQEKKLKKARKAVAERAAKSEKERNVKKKTKDVTQFPGDRGGRPFLNDSPRSQTRTPHVPVANP
ncbi:hypothetical protein CYMTET_37113 [Cymbomonas tetramitiformis]|uniref:Uncharacterized protein n=1 Tax=Cymbomonas tetramitiformis TaxID=36881 RepID=A0AAE0F6S1_9CHLO|nr:hypothetical protein CYMTET_37113 [Cymbomonas tetramitiformis]|eukprot:gene34700-biopygen35774